MADYLVELRAASSVVQMAAPLAGCWATRMAGLMVVVTADSLAAQRVECWVDPKADY